jgi:PAS domain S-box-containing protein
VQYQEWAKDPRGRPVYMVTLKTPYYDAEGDMMGVIGIGRDATDLKMAEEALQRSHGENEQLIDSLSSMLISLSPAMHITQWNPKAVEILGIEAQAAENWNIRDLNLPWDWPSLEADFERAQAKGEPLYLDPVPFERPDGSDGFLGMSITPIFGDHRRLSGFILMGADITKRKILEQRLAQAEKLEAIGQLAAGIAHEINTPTQYVNDNLFFLEESWVEVFSLLKLYGELVTMIQQAGIELEQFRIIEARSTKIDVDYLAREIPLAVTQSLEGIARVAEIVRAMKRFSYLGGEEKQKVDLNLAVESTINVARNEWKYVATVETELDPAMPPVLCYPGEINQVLLNLITNAAHAIEDRMAGKDGKGIITVRTELLGDQVEIRVQDTGTGIPEEIQNRIFDPFFTTKDVGRGTGQGLAISYDVVVKKHAGDISFVTERGKGTTFKVCLPIEYHPEGKGDLAKTWLDS